jgi:DNA replication protein
MSPSSLILHPSSFKGFPARVRFARIPAPFFSELLPQIDHLGELKVTLYALWFLDKMEGSVRYLRQSDFSSDTRLMQGLEPDADQTLVEALQRAVGRGALLKAELAGDDYYFLNSPRGRSAVEALARGDWRPSGDPSQPIALDLERPNIYRLYEENIGPLTPIIADELKEAEQTYSLDWIEDAVRIAVESNVRRWRYIQAILRSRQEEGRDEQNRGDTEKDRQRYIKGWHLDQPK